MKIIASQFANEIYQMSLKARFADAPDRSKKCRVLMTVFLREMLQGAGSGPC